MILKISEIFSSIQGEGPNIGKSAVFIRTAECNLKCTWCDTRYTWDWKNYEYKKEVKVMTILDAEDRVKKFGISHLVITGGEPMLQQHSLIPLISSLKKSNYYIEIETNGTIIPVTEMIGQVDQWNVSPKTSNSQNSFQICENSRCFEIFKRLGNAYFKFIVDRDEDIIEIENLISKYNLPKNRIILMPQASNSKELSDKINWVNETAKLKGHLFSTRLHIQLWGNKRGL